MVPAFSCLPDDLAALGYPRDAGHLFGRLQRVSTWSEGGPDLSRAGRELAERALDLRLPRIADEAPSADGSRRLVVELADGARIEAVHMPRALRRPRTTICLSSQVGCAMGCTFCATAEMGLVRNLEAHEIVGQLLAVLAHLGPKTADTLNLVFMGMGEPLHNVDALVRALDVLCDPRGLGIAPSRITVSTSGHLAGLERLAKARYLPELAVSVNGASTEVRRSLMPIDKRWGLTDLREALARWPKRPHSKLTLEYVLLGGVNDGEGDADRLAAWTGDLRHVIDVIPFNAWEGATYQQPSPARIAAFVARLREHGCLVKVRATRGRDARGACGTLVA
ncbi:MAG: 23S rRNA (adenine(2503)-C(2))-methyltransferase RlmN [Deltaproteobacteria bacterium]|nr:23S rRNA (adenine(2503)-C(2))-methyltransferase RlmN [Deltaproteobacteria bacterium]